MLSRRALWWTVRNHAVARIVARLRPGMLDRLVWADLERTPGFNEDMRAAEADMAAGRWYSFDTTTGTSTPNPAWPKDGPQP